MKTLGAIASLALVRAAPGPSYRAGTGPAAAVCHGFSTHLPLRMNAAMYDCSCV